MKYVEEGTNYSHSMGYEYDTINNLTKLVETINGVEHTTSYEYDLDNRVTSVTHGDTVKEYSYDSYSRVDEQVTKHNGTTVLTEGFTYRAPTNTTTTGQVASYSIDASDFDVTYSYTYDDNGNILSVSDGTNTTSYVYDTAGQLLRENNQAANKTWTWEYDDAGNILSRSEYNYTVDPLDGVTPVDTVTYTYGDTSWGDLLTAYDGVAITHDEIGNPLTDGTWTYTWEHGRQLAKMESDAATWTYTYNSSGLRTKRTNGTTTYEYIYNGSSLVRMTVGSDTLYFGTGTVTYNGTVYYYVTNIQGDVIAILNGSGTAVVTYTYDAWGNILTATGTMASTLGAVNPLRYRGYVYDVETGQYYLQSRYYDPKVGRFINADGYVISNQSLLGSNMFAYCGNDPVNRKDSLGTSWLEEFWEDLGDFVGEITDAVEDSEILGYLESAWDAVESKVSDEIEEFTEEMEEFIDDPIQSLHNKYDEYVAPVVDSPVGRIVTSTVINAAKEGISLAIAGLAIGVLGAPFSGGASVETCTAVGFATGVIEGGIRGFIDAVWEEIFHE